MIHGYYDPRTPGHCVLNEHEFSKACSGVLSAYIAGWSHYIGVEEVKRILLRVHDHPQLWEKAEGIAFDTMLGSDMWNIRELRKACEASLMGACRCWAAFIGADEVRACLKHMLDETDWDSRQKIVCQVVERFIHLDRTEGVD